MPDAGWDRMKRIFEAVLERPPIERRPFLSEACGSDAELLEQIEGMLQVHERDVGLLDPATGREIDAHAGDGLQPGTRVGGYRILRQIGSGGMGLIFESEQDKPRRIVALKVLRVWLASAEAKRRFERESEVLARLDHPGIVQILEAGTFQSQDESAGREPRPFFAMQLIKGQPLTEHVRKNALDVRKILDLVARVCDAVHYAHTHGVIHRDLKPGNILIDDVGQPRILDFGVSRVIDPEARATLQTEIGQVLGTLDYMSPEQLSGDSRAVDLRADVYSLGVILYELLAGHLPHDVRGKSLPMAARLIEQQDPPTLSTFDRRFEGDIDTIVGKALEKNRDRRYDSAAALAEDLRRHLRDEPIHARPPSTLYRFNRFTRRHRAVVLGLAAAFIALVLGLVGTGLGLLRARAAEGAARSEADKALAVSRFLAETLSKGDPLFATAMAPPYHAGRDLTLAQVLQDAAVDLDARFAGQPEVELILRQSIGKALFGLGSWSEAESVLRRALELSSKRSMPDCEEAIEILVTLSSICEWKGDYDEARDLAEQAFAMAERLHGPAHRDCVLAETRLARVLCVMRDKEAEPRMRHALETARVVLSSDDSLLASTLVHLTDVLNQCGKADEGEVFGREAVALGRSVLGTDQFLLYLSLTMLGNAIISQGRVAESEPVYREALSGYRRILGEDHPWTWIAQGNVGCSLEYQELHAEAEPFLREAVKKLREGVGDDQLETANMVGYLVRLLERTERAAEAVPLKRLCVAAYELKLGPIHPRTRCALDGLAQTLELSGDLDAAIAVLCDRLERTEECQRVDPQRVDPRDLANCRERLEVLERSSP